MLDYELPNTKLALVLAAGELFSGKGFDGVTTREIAIKAGVKLGSMHYHFGSKEALYVETFRYALEKSKRPYVQDIIDQNPSKMLTPEGIAWIIYKCIKIFMKSSLVQQEPEWFHQLMLREITIPSSAMPLLMKEIIRPDHEGYVRLYKASKPDSSIQDANIWIFSLFSQAFFYNLAGVIVDEFAGMNALTPEMVNNITKCTAKMMILAVELPLPDDLR